MNSSQFKSELCKTRLFRAKLSPDADEQAMIASLFSEIKSDLPRKGLASGFESHKKYMSEFREKWGHSWPSIESLKKINKFAGDDRIIDAGCGRGLWSALLFLSKKTVVAIDNFENPMYKAESCLVTPVQAEAELWIEKNGNPEDVLFMSWPPCWGDMASSCLAAHHGSKLIYIGEPWGGCTADDDFFDMLDNGWNMVGNYPMKNFQGINDHLILCVRKD
jgi:hypothetical protein